jgi:hypothetical protein
LDSAYGRTYARKWRNESLAAFASGADTPTALARACHREEVTGKDLLDFLERRLAQRGARP